MALDDSQPGLGGTPYGRNREQWRRNFIDYMRPHAPESFVGRLQLDVRTGSDRHPLVFLCYCLMDLAA
jgi:hypothetical protein